MSQFGEHKEVIGALGQYCSKEQSEMGGKRQAPGVLHCTGACSGSLN